MATEPVHPEPVLHNRRGHSSERPAYCKKKKEKKMELEESGSLTSDYTTKLQ